MISVVVPIYNEEENIVSFHSALHNVLRRIPENSEVVYVNDGSRDTSLDCLLSIQRQDPDVTVVELSRNFGHQAALTAGLSIARGDAIILMDGDFQDPPEVLPRLYESWKQGAKVVIANRTSRADKGIRAKLFPLFYKVLNLLADFPIPLNAGIFGLLDRQAVDVINSLQESNRYLPGMRAWVGFPTSFVYYDRADRAAGTPKQNLRRLFKYAFDAIFSFSYKPLRLGMALGTGILGLGLLLSLILVALTLLDRGSFGNVLWLSIIVCMLFLGGVELICVGLLGEYIGRIYDEVRRRPLFVIQNVHRSWIAADAADAQRDRVLKNVESAA